MLALRQIYTNQKQQLVIKLPPEFDAYERIEVIILPVESNISSSLSTKEFIERFAGAIPDFPELESPGELQEREEW
jgi:hypothetical protein